MSDFDFDEIDKAVSNAINGTPSPVPTQTSTPASSRASVTAQVPEAEPEPEHETETTPAPVIPEPVVEEPKPVSTPPPVRRSSGQFMDIAHPAFTMRKPTAPQEPVEPMKPAPIVTPTEPQFIDSFEAEPLESPFITDAKVEKRPLGGEAPTATGFNALELLEAPDDPRLEAHTMPDPIEFAAVEAPEPEAEPEVEVEEAQEPEQSEEKPVETEQGHVPQGFEYGAGTFEPAPNTVGTSVSIAQQYQEKTSDAAETGAIYDTENYHQPLAHGAKKRSSLWVIILIILLVVLGGALGAGAYFFIVPTL